MIPLYQLKTGDVKLIWRNHLQNDLIYDRSKFTDIFRDSRWERKERFMFMDSNAKSYTATRRSIGSNFAHFVKLNKLLRYNPLNKLTNLP